MAPSKYLAPTPTDLIDWLNGEDLLDLDWDFPEDGNLVEAGLDASVVARMLPALEEEFDIEIDENELTPAVLASPRTLADMIASRRQG